MREDLDKSSKESLDVWYLIKKIFWEASSKVKNNIDQILWLDFSNIPKKYKKQSEFLYLIQKKIKWS